MAKKALANAASVSGVGATAPAKRTAKSRTAKVAPETTVASEAPVTEPVAEAVMSTAPVEDAHAAIAKLAYQYWEARGRQNGSQAEDWLRAEREYHRAKA